MKQEKLNTQTTAKDSQLSAKSTKSPNPRGSMAFCAAIAGIRRCMAPVPSLLLGCSSGLASRVEITGAGMGVGMGVVW